MRGRFGCHLKVLHVRYNIQIGLEWAEFPGVGETARFKLQAYILGKVVDLI